MESGGGKIERLSKRMMSAVKNHPSSVSLKIEPRNLCGQGKEGVLQTSRTKERTSVDGERDDERTV